MQILLYEFVTGGGWWSVDAARPPAGSLLAEGRAMIRALAEDFARLPGVEVVTSRDARLPEFHPSGCRVDILKSAAAEWNWLASHSARADGTLLIAPETGGSLLRRCRLVEEAGGRLLSPSAAVVEIAGNKQATADWLARCGVPTPCGDLTTEPRAARFPVVVKPLDGCGSQGVRLIASAAEFPSCAAGEPLRIEEFVPGLAASASVLCGPGGSYVLPACEQRLSADGAFTYMGGRLPLATELAARAQRLALAAAEALPQPRGYLGVDLVLGAAADGSGDRVIEINPRLTTSYVGLRALSIRNLAAAMLEVLAGDAPDMRFADRSIEFTSDGVIS